MQKYQDVVLDSNGTALQGATIAVYDNGTGALSTIYSNNTGTVSANPVSSDATGNFSFYAENGRYNIVATYGGVVINKTDILLEDTAQTSPTYGAAFVEASDGSAGSLWTSVQGGLDTVDVKFANYAALRAYTGTRHSTCRITNSGIAGFFYYDSTDVVSADNGGTIIVDASGRRWKRFYNGAIELDWFNPTGNGVADDTAAVTAWAALGGILTATPGKTYLISAEVPIPSNVIFDLRKATIKANTRIRSYFLGNNVTNVKIFNGIYDLGQTVLATYTAADYAAAVNIGSIYNSGFLFMGASDIELAGNEFKNLYTTSVYAYNCSGTNIIRNGEFNSPVQAQKYLMNHIAVQSCTGNFEIHGNEFVSAAPSSPDFGVVAFVASGTTGNIHVHDNWADYCGRNTTGTHQLSPISFYGDSLHADIHDNYLTNCLYGGIRFTSIWNALAHDNYISLAPTIGDTSFQLISVESSWFGGTYNGCRNVHVHDNILDFPAGGYGVVAVCVDFAVPVMDLNVHDNTIINSFYALTMLGSYDGCRFEDNDMTGSYGNAIQVTLNGVATALHGTTQAQSVMNNLKIKNNKIHGTGAASARIPLFVDMNTYTGSVGLIEVEENNVVSDAATAINGIFVRGTAVGAPAVTQGNAKVGRNNVNNYSTGFNVTQLYKATVSANQAPNCTTPFSVGSGINTLIKTDNQYSVGGVLSGRAVLVAGTATVNTAEVQTAENIVLTVAVAGGTLGIHSVGAIVAGTSFVINSTNAADTSTIYWEIRH